MDKLPFNPNPSTILHIDLNSCFATVEQQANPHLRGKPIAVAAYNSPNGCILAPSVEAKEYGVKTGMRVKDGKFLCPSLIVLSSDPSKYRNVHLKLRKLLSRYTFDVTPKSIDEFVLNLERYPCLVASSMQQVAREIKLRIKKEIGEWIRVSIGIAPNRFLAKTAASLHKPDGLDEINIGNYLETYRTLNLMDLCGIKLRNAARLASFDIHTVLDFYDSPIWKLKAAFNSIVGYYWHLRLRGWEIDNFIQARRSYGNSFALPRPLIASKELSPILSKLVEKTSARFRKAGYKVKGVHLAISFRDGSFWHKGVSTEHVLFDSRDIYKEAYKILVKCPYLKPACAGRPVRELAVSVFNLLKCDSSQLELFRDVGREKKLTDSIDKINSRWGSFVIFPARMAGTENLIPDRIAFGGVKELEELVTGR